ncbi:MAG: alanine--tRNA ligase [Chitinophagaceae bacterium]|nr:alanine--tRNA ligase [Chitinophagaceae bacterium]
MNAKEIRKTFLDFFESKSHTIVSSAPIVMKNDPTLMFTNAGMNQFKDIFLGDKEPAFRRIADTQKCLRVSGKHNDLEEVGIDTYHHTMFEMLGNWSFADYFKKDAIAWAWELLTEIFKIPVDRLYVTIFEGDENEKLTEDKEALDFWKTWIPEDRIIRGNKKDNFWEMGETGPCGPCSEIHVDNRTDEERRKIDGKLLVNIGDPQVIEIWNNVFMEFERKADGSLVKLPKQHVDTGMGFERLVRVLQGKQSNYDTDVFTPLIHKIEELSGLKYNVHEEEKHKKQQLINIAMRVIADHIRTISFSIADGQLPSNTGAGYVIRRILRRAIRYGYQTLNLKEPFMFRIVPTLAHQMGEAFPELHTQKILIEKVIKEEELSFYKTLEVGLKRIDQVCIDTNAAGKKVIDGKVVFELYDTFGFPVDLTSLIAKGYDLSIDEKGFDKYLQEQKDRSRIATAVDTDDWMYVEENKKLIEDKEKETDFVGYTDLESDSFIVRFRKVKAKNKEQYHLVLNKTPFYAESGGQVGDSGVLENINETIYITDTKKENGVIIHYTDKLPEKLNATFAAKVYKDKRLYTSNNHSATHLLHAALRMVLGTHVEQKGSLVNDEHLRFDFSHFAKITDEEIFQIEKLVNTKIRENIPVQTDLMTIEDAKKTGAMALFGEKYGDVVRVVTIDKKYSTELCGGTHVKATGQIGYFKIMSEGAVAAGIRRIEAVTSIKSEEHFDIQTKLLNEVRTILKGSKDVVKSLNNLVEENNELQKQLQIFLKEKVQEIKKDLIKTIEKKGDINFIAQNIKFDSAEDIKNMLFEMKNEVPNLVCVITAEVKGKPSISVIINDELVKSKNLNAGNIVRELAKEINGGGGGQPFYAQAGGSKLEGLQSALEKAKKIV